MQYIHCKYKNIHNQYHGYYQSSGQLMKRKNRLRGCFRLFSHQGGFTLIELLVVVAILGTMGGVATMNVGKFIGSGQEEAKNVEQHQVQVAVLCYIADGNTIKAPFIVGPKGQGVLDSYLIGNLVYSWKVDTDGSVSPFELKPKPKPKPVPNPNLKPLPF